VNNYADAYNDLLLMAERFAAKTFLNEIELDRESGAYASMLQQTMAEALEAPSDDEEIGSILVEYVEEHWTEFQEFIQPRARNLRLTSAELAARCADWLREKAGMSRYE